MMRTIGVIILCLSSGLLGRCEAIAHDAASRARAIQSSSDVFYEIFVRSFKDSDGDGKGDLPGVLSKLDYLEGLGLTGIWLTPVFPSPSYHGYDVLDYQGVAQELGGPQALKNLISEMHQRRLKLILDLPVNHTSLQHPWFSEHDLYVWSPKPISWSAMPNSAAHWFSYGKEYYFATFSSKLPDLNWRSSEVERRVTQVFLDWASQGVDGFRLDAARHLVEGPQGETDTFETHQIWQRITAAVKAKFPQVVFIGEVWADSKTIGTYFGGGRELDQAFAFPVAGGLVDSLKKGDPGPLQGALRQELSDLPFPEFAAPFLTNHDMPRVATQLQASATRLKVAALALLSLPGTPYLYYGEEIGLPEGSGAGDLPKRSPMLWSSASGRGFTKAGVQPWNAFASSEPSLNVEAQQGVQDSLLETYRSLIQNRKAHSALTGGSLEQIQSTANSLSFVRKDQSETLMVVLPLGARAPQLKDLKPPQGVHDKSPKAVYGNPWGSDGERARGWIVEY